MSTRINEFWISEAQGVKGPAPVYRKQHSEGLITEALRQARLSKGKERYKRLLAERQRQEESWRRQQGLM